MTPSCTVCGHAVEWVRTCFGSHFRLFAGHPEILTPGGYVFAPTNAQHYRGWHNLGSRDWTSGERDPWPSLGEYAGVRSYANGQRGEFFPAAVTLGSADCLRDGETFTGVAPPNVPLQGGFPLTCFAAPIPHPADLVIDVTSRTWARDFAGVLDRFTEDPTAAGIALQALLGVDAVISVTPNNTSNIPGTLIGITPTQTVVLVAGTSNYQQLSEQVMYANSPMVNVGNFSTNLRWWSGYLAINQRIADLGPNPNNPIVFAGHSYGGVIATIAAARAKAWQPGRPVQLMTFGMPKPGDSRLIALLPTIPARHYWNSDDPVPSVPPARNEVLQIDLAGVLTLSERWNRYERAPSGIALRADGATFESTASNFTFSLLYEAVFSAVGALPFPDLPAHEIKAYFIRLSLTPP